MTVATYTVSDAEGNTTEQAGKIVGISKDPFRFYVSNPDKEPKDNQEPFLKVQIVMPLGGREAGLFRFPRVGEQVLVGTEGLSNYLMGYIPTYTSGTDATDTTPAIEAAQDFQTVGMFEDDGKGEVFRYEQTGKKPGIDTERYSEIGFYHKKTQWDVSEDARSQYADVGDTEKKTYHPPLIDLINIHSTGDIHESAVNHHRIEAKRLELLVDSKADKPNAFKAGDLRIKAGESITIEAGDKLILKAGRGSITISDSGVTISHQLMRHLSNPADASVSLNAREGVSIAGETVDVSADHAWSIGEKLGSSVSGTAGALSLGGREISAAVPEWIPQLGVNIAYALNSLQKITVGGMALTTNPDTGKKKNALIAQLSFSVGKSVSDIVFTCLKFHALWGKFRNYDSKASPEMMLAAAIKAVDDAAGKNDIEEVAAAKANLANTVTAFDAVMLAEKETMDVSPNMLFLGGSYLPAFEQVAIGMNFVLDLAGKVFAAVELALQRAKKKDALQGDKLDQFNYASMVVVNGLIMIFTGIQLGLTAAAKEGGSAALCLGFDGSIVTKVAKGQAFYAVTEQKGAAPAPMISNWVYAGAVTATAVPKLASIGMTITKAVDALRKMNDPETVEVL
ncbi:MAG: phage baseplate assembly protein V [Spirochaetaceae bacterium]|jgi:hypothetical protein|nr:phage baseplate assembly protein V [Spirochaetaceae bacterium]